jgi:glycosyltransferase involved in cell wall biosynthesis
VIGYIPFDAGTSSAEARWVGDHFGCDVLIPGGLPPLNRSSNFALPSLATVRDAIAPLLPADWVIAEGPAGFLWAAVLRQHGFDGGVTILPYLNPRRWQDVADAVLFTRFHEAGDRVYVGSTPSARIYRRLGLSAHVGEPYGIDDRTFRLRPHAIDVFARLNIPRGRLLLFAGRAQADKDLYRLLRVSLKARILFPDLRIIFASHVIDEEYVALLRREVGPDAGLHVIERPDRDDLADLFCAADVFVTAATSPFETFGRAPAEALACGTPAVAPRYDGFAEVLAQPGGRLVGIEMDESGPHVCEDELLRSIYDVLSAPCSVPPSQVSSAAHRRFARSRTIELLAHVVDNDTPAPAPSHSAAPLTLPGPWADELETLTTCPAGVALERVWNFHGEHGPESVSFSAEDPLWVAAVRRALCVHSTSHPLQSAAEEPGSAA